MGHMVKISKTYKPKSTEKYMCEKHKLYFKKKLTNWKAEIIKTNNLFVVVAHMSAMGGIC